MEKPTVFPSGTPSQTPGAPFSLSPKTTKHHALPSTPPASRSGTGARDVSMVFGPSPFAFDKPKANGVETKAFGKPKANGVETKAFGKPKANGVEAESFWQAVSLLERDRYFRAINAPRIKNSFGTQQAINEQIKQIAINGMQGSLLKKIADDIEQDTQLEGSRAGRIHLLHRLKLDGKR